MLFTSCQNENSQREYNRRPVRLAANSGGQDGEGGGEGAFFFFPPSAPASGTHSNRAGKRGRKKEGKMAREQLRDAAKQLPSGMPEV